MSEQDNKDLVVQIQRFTASSIGMLTLLNDVCTSRLSDNTNVSQKERTLTTKFLNSSKQFLTDIKQNTDTFNSTRFVKKAYTALRTIDGCNYLKAKDSKLFSMRDDNKRIVTILSGIDLRIGYRLLNEEQLEQFWQYIYLFSSSVYNMIKQVNAIKFNNQIHVNETLQYIEGYLTKTGIIFNNMVFNPFIGVGESKEQYSLNEMFTGKELPKEHKMSIDSVLNMLGVDKMLDEHKLDEQLRDIGQEQVNEATEKIASLLGAENNSEIKEVCETLIQDIVVNLRENGIGNIGETLQKVAQNARGKIELSKMQKTAESMKNFMANSQERVKNLKDENGNPIGEELLNNLSMPMNMLNAMNFGNLGNINNPDNNNSS
jgi:hypothetical protein